MTVSRNTGRSWLGLLSDGDFRNSDPPCVGRTCFLPSTPTKKMTSHVKRIVQVRPLHKVSVFVFFLSCSLRVESYASRRWDWFSRGSSPNPASEEDIIQIGYESEEERRRQENGTGTQIILRNPKSGDDESFKFYSCYSDERQGESPIFTDIASYAVANAINRRESRLCPPRLCVTLFVFSASIWPFSRTSFGRLMILRVPRLRNSDHCLWPFRLGEILHTPR